ncbi:alpha/beta fold hydrolase [Glacieibacterium sp.]|uniref:alpha/beta fold hydrolase n=1 Tax=Glacieibacterium sp. TaxID=2860237 RepID=UPI003B00A857
MTPDRLEWLAAGPGKPWLHFAHATGMCAAVYAQLLEPLAGEFNIVASDLRGHGGSTLPAEPATLHSWATYRNDLAGILADYSAAGPWLLAGHSMGASVSLLLAATRPELASAVVMIEPAFVPLAHAADWQPHDNHMTEQAAKRRALFPSRAAAADNWRGRGVFRGWPEAALAAYVSAGMRDRPDGQVELACSPTWESATFRAVTNEVEAAVRDLRCPLALLHGTIGSTVAPVDAAAISAMRPGTIVERFDGASHFLPLEQPDRVRAAIRAALSPERPGR